MPKTFGSNASGYTTQADSVKVVARTWVANRWFYGSRALRKDHYFEKHCTARYSSYGIRNRHAMSRRGPLSFKAFRAAWIIGPHGLQFRPFLKYHDGTASDTCRIISAMLVVGSALWVSPRQRAKEVKQSMQAKWLVTLFLAAGALCAASSVLAAEKDNVFRSGLHPGDRLASFKCHSVAGPDKGKPLCYV